MFSTLCYDEYNLSFMEILMARRKNWLASSLIALMRLHYQQGHPINELARVYRVHPSVVANICHGHTHRRVVAADPSDGTSLEDVARRMGVPERPPKKEGRRRLSVGQVAQIRAHYQKGRRIKELAEAFDLHPNVVANICHGRTHPRVPAAEGREIRPMPRRRSTRSNVAVAGRPSGDAARIQEAHRKTASEKSTTSKEISIGGVRYRVDQYGKSTPVHAPTPATEWNCRECGFESNSREEVVEHINTSHPEELAKSQTEYEAKQPGPESEAPQPSPAPAKPVRKPEHAPRLVGDEYRCWVAWCAFRDRSEAIVHDHIDQVNAGTAEHLAPKLPSTESD